MTDTFYFVVKTMKGKSKPLLAIYQTFFFASLPTEFFWRKRAERIKILVELNAINLINLPCDTRHKKVKGQSLAFDLTFPLQPRRSQWGPTGLSQLPAALDNAIGHSVQLD